jgi:opacity protein-like surface antigen
VGGGIEWAVTDNWTVKTELDYLKITENFVIPANASFLAGDAFTNGNHSVIMAKVGVNYLFNWSSPVVARY